MKKPLGRNHMLSDWFLCMEWGSQTTGNRVFWFFMPARLHKIRTFVPEPYARFWVGPRGYLTEKFFFVRSERLYMLVRKVQTVSFYIFVLSFHSFLIKKLRSPRIFDNTNFMIFFISNNFCMKYFSKLSFLRCRENDQVGMLMYWFYTNPVEKSVLILRTTWPQIWGKVR